MGEHRKAYMTKLDAATAARLDRELFPVFESYSMAIYRALRFIFAVYPEGVLRQRLTDPQLLPQNFCNQGNHEEGFAVSRVTGHQSPATDSRVTSHPSPVTDVPPATGAVDSAEGAEPAKALKRPPRRITRRTARESVVAAVAVDPDAVARFSWFPLSRSVFGALSLARRF